GLERVRRACGLEQLRVDVLRSEHDLAIVCRTHRKTFDGEVAGRLDVDHEMIALDAAHRPDLLATFFEKDLIADLYAEIVLGHASPPAASLPRLRPRFFRMRPSARRARSLSWLVRSVELKK